ncbi:MAG: hypothetical protein KC503_29615 [Myxococcales bacterium]|nr:hypothetical protein [Myxococcales bacterium]
MSAVFDLGAFSSAVGAAVAAIVVVLTIPLVKRLAHRVGAVSRPRADRWKQRSIPMLGGVAIFAGVMVASVLFAPLDKSRIALLACASVMFFLGLVDDVHEVKPYVKLIVQLLAALAFSQLGGVLPWTKNALFNQAVSVFWLVGISNAFNLLDNMDGLCGGIGAIAAAFLAYFLWSYGQTDAVTLSLAMAAALAGFLVFNFSPASVFMGDSGSQFVGFFIGGLALLSKTYRTRNLLAVVAVPLLVLLLPILDTTFVTVLRLLNNRPVSQGGRDHTSHRLVQLGMSERRAVLILYGFTAASGAMAVLVRSWDVGHSIALLPFFALAVVLVAVYLSSVTVISQPTQDESGRNNRLQFLVRLRYKRQIAAITADLVVVAASYYGAYLLRFGGFEDPALRALFTESLPVVLGVQLLALWLLSGYSEGWRHFSVASGMRYARAVVVGTAGAALLLLYITRFEGYSRAVFVIHGLICLIAVLALRSSFRMVDELLTRARTDGVASLIYGAGAGGDLLVREAQANPAIALRPIGFIDDDMAKRGLKIRGIPVLGSGDEILTILNDRRVEQVVVSSQQIPSDKVDNVAKVCSKHQIPVRRARIVIE